MSNNIKDLFFSEKNLDFTYGIVKQEVEKRCGYNIERQPMLKASYTKMALVVYEKTTVDDMNLVSLNNNLVDKSSIYFDKLIQSKRARKQTSNGTTIDRPSSTQTRYDNELGLSIMSNNNDINTNYDKIVQDRQRLNQGPSLDIMPRQQIADNTITKSDSIRQYQQIINQRNNANTQSNIQPNNLNLNVNNALQNIRQPTNQNTDYNVLPFTLSDDFTSIAQNTDRPIYQNMNSLNELDSQDPMKLLEQYQTQRNVDFQNYQNMEQSNNEIASRIKENIGNSEFLSRENDLLSTKIDTVSADPSILFRQDNQITQKMITNMTERDIGTNMNGLMDDMVESEQVIRNVINNQIEEAPSYIEKTHYVSINSIDRNWTSQQENRYNFKVNFDPAEGQTGAGVSRIFKNIVSIEPINVILSHDTEIVPYDNRIFLDALHYPYLLLHIEELDGVFRGTNTHNDNVFSHLVFDKEHYSRTLTSDYITSNINITAGDGGTINFNSFDKQFSRGFIRFCPGYFEKKNFYNNPLASLNRMSIKITDPYGRIINNQSDVLEISTFTFEAAADKLIDATTGFPLSAVSGNQTLKLTSIKKFSNKLIRIGDKVRVSGVVSDNGTFQSFINRDEGHTVINLDNETNNNDASGNKGFITNLYIPPPGELDSNNNLTKYSNSTGTLTAITGSVNGYLINESIQAHLLFKFVTRDADTTNVIKSLNV